MKTLKKSLAVLLAVMLLSSLSVSAFAFTISGIYTITINNSTPGHTYEAYQIFAGDLSGNILSNVVWGSGVNGPAALTDLQAEPTIGSLFANATNAADVSAAMDGILSESAQAKAFAQVVGDNLVTVAGTSVAGTNNYIISGLEAGYYLVKDQNASVRGDDAYTRFLLQVVKDVTVSPKSDLPTVEKKVQENHKYQVDDGYGLGYNDVADYHIGENIPFKLIGTLPDNYADYTSYNYVFTDTASTGLTINLSTVKVYVDGTEITTGFTSDLTGQVLTVAFADLKGIATVTAASKIVVEYTALLNQNAEIGLDGNENKVTLTYSNNPNVGGIGNTGTTPEDKVIVFTYELDTTKVDGMDATKKLQGAKFKLYKNVTVGAVTTTYYANIVNDIVTSWVTNIDGATALTSDVNGLFKIIGLDDGTYYLKEIVAPIGYNRLGADVEFNINATTTNSQAWNGVPNTALTALAIVVNGGTPVPGNTTTGIVTMDIANNRGTSLPETGGIGTTLFYIVGGILVVGTAILLITRKRVENKAKAQ